MTAKHKPIVCNGLPLVFCILFKRCKSYHLNDTKKKFENRIDLVSGGLENEGFFWTFELSVEMFEWVVVTRIKDSHWKIFQFDFILSVRVASDQTTRNGNKYLLHQNQSCMFWISSSFLRRGIFLQQTAYCVICVYVRCDDHTSVPDNCRNKAQ